MALYTTLDDGGLARNLRWCERKTCPSSASAPGQADGRGALTRTRTIGRPETA